MRLILSGKKRVSMVNGHPYLLTITNAFPASLAMADFSIVPTATGALNA